MNRYDDIINLPHPDPRTHPRMAAMDRAAQFSPFAALTGYGEAVEEAARLTQRQMDLSEDEKAVLDQKLYYLEQHIAEECPVRITCFVPDERKEGGAYVTRTGIIRKIDHYGQKIFLQDATEIRTEHITDITILHDRE